MIKYPGGKQFTITATKHNKSKQDISFSSANRGMNLEHDINLSNEYYAQNNMAVVTKRPTPISVLRVDYSRGCKIVDAFFEKPSTTDYNGVYKGRYLDFEAKSTQNKTSFPLANITPHQIKHLKSVLSQNGIAFFIIEFAKYNEVYLIDASYVIYYYENEKRRSIPYEIIKIEGTKIKQGYSPRLDWLKVVQIKYFDEKN